MIVPVALLVGADMNADREQLPARDLTVGILEVDPPLPDAFDLRSGQDNARLVLFLHEIIVPCFFVLRNDLLRFFSVCHVVSFRTCGC